MSISRRNLLLTLGAASMMLASCSVVKNGSSTKLELDTIKVVNYAQAGLNAAATVAGVVSLVPGMSDITAKFSTVITSLSTNLTAFKDKIGSDIVIIEYNDSNWKSIVDSILKDIETISSIITAFVAQVTESNAIKDSKVVDQMSIVATAIATIVAIFKAAVGAIPDTAAKDAKYMSESEALAVLGV